MALNASSAEMDELVDLVKRVARAEGSDPDLEQAVWRCVQRAMPAGETGLPENAGPITSSLDAALDLVNTLRRGWIWKLQRSLKGGSFYKFTLDPPGGVPVRGYHAAIPSLAAVDALLRSIIEQQPPR